MRARAIAIAVALAGCRGKSAPAKTPPTVHDATVHDAAPRPFYASLFEPGASWKFDVEDTHGGYGEDDKYVEDVEHLVLSCHVDAVEHHGDTDESEIVCDEGWPTIGDLPMSGTWSMNARGLWMGEVEGDPVIANPPEMWNHDETDEDSGAVVEQSQLYGSGDVWCWRTSQTQGDVFWARLCLGPDGPTEGDYGHSAAEEYTTSFTRSK